MSCSSLLCSPSRSPWSIFFSASPCLEPYGLAVWLCWMALVTLCGFRRMDNRREEDHHPDEAMVQGRWSRLQDPCW
jgi:hypothetical protein